MTPPQITSSALSLDFGSEVAGKLSDEQIVTFTNAGGGDLIIGDSEFIGAAPVDFGLTMDFCSFQVLGAGESCDVGFSMRATELGERVAQFVIQSNDPEQPLLFMDLRGNGTGSGGCGLSPSLPSLEFFFGWMIIMALLWFKLRKTP
ncbi:MAG TPA: choice-of-anchor D domain-containing protein [bacterium]|nr:choice-of-anchor D domain-containing protein [bacterium]